MAEKPIIFSGEMVRAILDGRKTQTRRVIKPQPGSARVVKTNHPRQAPETIFGVLPDKEDDGKFSGYLEPGSPAGIEQYAAYRPGDLLWVRESFKYLNKQRTKVGYKASPDETCTDGPFVRLGNWKPSIHIPKWAARLWLKVLKVRAERVQEISTIEAMREGVLPEPDARVETKICVMGKQPREIFGLVWDSLNAKPKPAKKNPYTAEPELCQVAYPWEDVREITTINRKASKWYGLKVYVCGNPAIFVYEFERTNHG